MISRELRQQRERGRGVRLRHWRNSRLIVLVGALVTFCLLVSCSVPSKPVHAGIPERIISVVPNVTETLYAFGLGDKVIAVGDYDRFPPQVNEKPRIGGLINPNIEKIIEMHPDLVITYGSQDVLRDRLQSVGIRMFPFSHGNVEHTLQYMLELGRVVGAESQAQRDRKR